MDEFLDTPQLFVTWKYAEEYAHDLYTAGHDFIFTVRRGVVVDMDGDGEIVGDEFVVCNLGVSTQGGC